MEDHLRGASQSGMPSLIDDLLDSVTHAFRELEAQQRIVHEQLRCQVQQRVSTGLRNGNGVAHCAVEASAILHKVDKPMMPIVHNACPALPLTDGYSREACCSKTDLAADREMKDAQRCLLQMKDLGNGVESLPEWIPVFNDSPDLRLQSTQSVQSDWQGGGDCRVGSKRSLDSLVTSPTASLLETSANGNGNGSQHSSHHKVLKWRTISNLGSDEKRERRQEVIDQWERLAVNTLAEDSRRMIQIHEQWRPQKMGALGTFQLVANEIHKATALNTFQISMSTIKKGRAGSELRKQGFLMLRTSATAQFQLVQSMIQCPALHPNSGLRQTWDIISGVACAHDVIVLPMQVFDFGAGARFAQELIQQILTVFWTIDIFLGFCTGYYNVHGVVEMRHTYIASNYIKTWFLLDVGVTLTDWLVLLTLDEASSIGVLRIGKAVMRFMRALRLLRLFKICKSLADWLHTISSESVFTLSRVVRLLLIIFLISHYLACAWYSLSQWAVTEGGRHDGWSQHVKDDHIAFMYFTSLHWSLTQFTPASMEVVPMNTFERVFACFVILGGLGIFSTFVSSITQAMTHLTRVRAKEEERIRLLRKFLHENNISRQLCGSIWSFLRTHRLGKPRLTKLTDIEVWHLLPRRMREDISYEAYMPKLVLHPLLCLMNHSHPVFMESLCGKAVGQRSLHGGEELFWKGADIEGMAFVENGCLDYQFTDDAKPTTFTLSSGGWCCEIVIWADQESCVLEGPITAGRTGASVFILSKREFCDICQSSDSDFRLLSVYAEKFVTRFNEACVTSDTNNILFSNPVVIEDVVDEAVRSNNMLQTLLSERKAEMSGFQLPPGRQSVAAALHLDFSSRGSCQSCESFQDNAG
eukprot:TRINITY_DN2884_c0_g1_i1.p1 TRINITY_DN2884_c0_g1~~TRINITY_DN2884_c0_g1_i1.p1  ORF type:complete len:869 (-),score=172.87 TRINITY_DN2884_c0_g1_i1:149-2755(-)